MNKKNLGIGALVVGVLVSLFISLFNGSTNTIVERVIEKVGEATNYDQVKAGDWIDYYKNLRLPAGTQSVCSRNTTGALVFADIAGSNIWNNSVASSSQKLDIATSSDGVIIGGLAAEEGGGYYASGTDADGISGALPFASILDSLIIATNTRQMGSSTNPLFALTQRLDAESANGWVPVQPEEYVCALVTELTVSDSATSRDLYRCNPTANPDADLNTCESATSTNSGINLDIGLLMHATSTINN